MVMKIYNWWNSLIGSYFQQFKPKLDYPTGGSNTVVCLTNTIFYQLQWALFPARTEKYDFGAPQQGITHVSKCNVYTITWMKYIRHCPNKQYLLQLVCNSRNKTWESLSATSMKNSCFSLWLEIITVTCPCTIQ